MAYYKTVVIKVLASEYRGVFYSKRHKRWVAKIGFNGKEHYLGYFEYEHDAAVAYNKAAINYYGLDARINIFQTSENKTHISSNIEESTNH